MESTIDGNDVGFRAVSKWQPCFIRIAVFTYTCFFASLSVAHSFAAVSPFGILIAALLLIVGWNAGLTGAWFVCTCVQYTRPTKLIPGRTLQV